VADTAAWMESADNFKDPGREEALNEAQYEVHGRSFLILIEK
jgi:hypothetical protein